MYTIVHLLPLSSGFCRRGELRSPVDLNTTSPLRASAARPYGGFSTKASLFLSLLITFATLLTPQYLFALPSDAQSKMYISAQNAQVDKLTGDSVYQGDVKIDRGTTHVTADKLTVKSVSGKVVLLTAFGHDQQLAHYQTKTDINKPVLDAYADIIKYYPPQHVVVLIGHAYVVQGNSQVKGPHLEYDLNKQVLVTTSDPKNPGQKTTFIIDPSELQGSEKKS